MRRLGEALDVVVAIVSMLAVLALVALVAYAVLIRPCPTVEPVLWPTVEDWQPTPGDPYPLPPPVEPTPQRTYYQ